MLSYFKLWEVNFKSNCFRFELKPVWLRQPIDQNFDISVHFGIVWPNQLVYFAWWLTTEQNNMVALRQSLKYGPTNSIMSIFWIDHYPTNQTQIQDFFFSMLRSINYLFKRICNLNKKYSTNYFTPIVWGIKKNEFVEYKNGFKWSLIKVTAAWCVSRKLKHFLSSNKLVRTWMKH